MKTTIIQTGERNATASQTHIKTTTDRKTTETMIFTQDNKAQGRVNHQPTRQLANK